MNPLLSSDILTLVTALVLVTGIALSWRSAAECGRAARVSITLLRTVALIGLLIIAWNPGEWKKEAESQKSVWAVLLDRSQSMATDDVSGQSRWEAATESLTSLDETVSNKFRLFTFADSLDGEITELTEKHKPDGQHTRIRKSCIEVLNLFQTGNAELKGIVLLSDGRTLSPESASEFCRQARARDVPVYSCVLGGEVARPDVSLNLRRRHRTAFRNQSVNITPTVQSTRVPPQRLQVTVEKESGRVLDKQRVDLNTDEQKDVKLTFSLSEQGYHALSLSVETVEKEQNVTNNSVTLGVNVLSEPVEVLVAEGLPYWDTKFLAELIRSQPSMNVTAVFRVATNRFFRIGPAASSEGRTVQNFFPQDMDELKEYDLLIFGKGIKYILNTERIGMLWKFVKNHGGSVIFSRGKPYAGSFAELEPLEPVVWGNRLDKSVRFQPTESGKNVNLFHSRLASPNAEIWGTLPRMTAQYRLRKLRSFSRVLVEGVSKKKHDSPVPIVVSRRFGSGLVVTVNADEMWKWDFFPKGDDSSHIYGEFWAQLAEWATTYSAFLPGQEVSLHAQPTQLQVNRPCHVTARFRSAEKSAALNPQLRLFKENRLVSKTALTQLQDKPQHWEAVLHPEKPGDYFIQIHDSSTDGPLGDARVTIRVNPPPSEKDKLSADPAFMRKLAENTGGRVAELEEIPQMLTSQQKTQQQAETQEVWTPAWANAWMLSLIALCFAGEWIIRRRHGLL